VGLEYRAMQIGADAVLVVKDAMDRGEDNEGCIVCCDGLDIPAQRCFYGRQSLLRLEE